jgi:hypothetical protein
MIEKDLSGAGKVPIGTILDPVRGIGHDHADGSEVSTDSGFDGFRYLDVYFRSYV